MSDRLRLTLYTRWPCQLCDEMKNELLPLLEGAACDFCEIDVDSDPSLQQRFGDRVPVLEANGRELCQHRLNVAVVVDTLKNKLS